MSNTATQTTYEVPSFDRAVTDLKQGAAYAAKAQAQASAKSVAAANDAVAFTQGTVEAYMQAGKILASGSQDLFRQAAASNQAAFAEALAGFRSLMATKTMKDGIELQANLVRTSATRAVSESSRLAQAGIDLATKASAPLVARAEAAAQTFTTSRA